MESKHGWRLYDNMDHWMPHFDRLAEAIRIKVELLSDQELNFLPGEFRVAMVTDCCNQIVSRPGSGPARDGVGAPRAGAAGWVQLVFYNGWLVSCGMKFKRDCLSTMWPHCIRIIWFIVKTQRPHLSHWKQYQWQTREAATGQRDPSWKFFKMYGDSIFPWMSCLLSRYKGDNISEIGKLENAIMSSCREHVEWHSSEIKLLFPFVDYHNKQQLLKTPVRETFVITMISRNFYVCRNENKNSKFFPCIPPSVEDWSR